MASPDTLSGARKAAIAMMVLGAEGASSVFRYLGEDEIGFWHEPDAGFAGRRPL